jgi:succinate dehydrogenase / fumarate reductase, membrane anchor subunit
VSRRVRQFGSTRDGLREWGLQRLTAIAVIPLSLYFAASVLSRATADRKTASDWLSLPVLALVVILVVLAGITHALIGIRAVVLDYVQTRTRSWCRAPLIDHPTPAVKRSTMANRNLALEARGR